MKPADVSIATDPPPPDAPRKQAKSKSGRPRIALTKVLSDLFKDNPQPTKDEAADYVQSAGVSASSSTIARRMKDINKAGSKTQEVQQPKIDAATPYVAERCILRLGDALRQIGAIKRWTPDGQKPIIRQEFLRLWGSLDETGLAMDKSRVLRFVSPAPIQKIARNRPCGPLAATDRRFTISRHKVIAQPLFFHTTSPTHTPTRVPALAPIPPQPATASPGAPCL